MVNYFFSKSILLGTLYSSAKIAILFESVNIAGLKVFIVLRLRFGLCHTTGEEAAAVACRFMPLKPVLRGFCL